MRLSFTSPQQLSSMSLKDQFFSQSTPVGLDCLRWPRPVSFSGEDEVTYLVCALILDCEWFLNRAGSRQF